MPDNKLPSPDQVLGEGKSKLPSPDAVFNAPAKSSGTDYSAIQLDINKENQLENTLDDIVKTSKRSISDGEKDLLRDMLSNPNLSPEQARESIQAIQGYHPKQKDNTLTTPDYYVKTDANGVVRPIPLGYGERPPKGYDVASVWGTQKEANDDPWYETLGKSVANGAVGLVKGVVDLGQMGYQLATDEESENLRATQQSLEGLKLKKDEYFDKQIYSTEGVKDYSDLISKDRFDLSPRALWGSFNSIVESMIPFLGGAGAASTAVKAVTGAEKIGKLGTAGSAMFGSYITMIGDNLEAAREAGLNPRDAAAVASAITTGQSLLDVKLGLGTKVFKNFVTDTEKQALKQFVKEAEKTATGELTENGFKQVVGEMMKEGAKKSVSSGLKEAAKDTGVEMLQEAGQEFIANAGEQLWDKMSSDEKAKFGTDALSAKSFGEYLANGINSLGVAPVSVVNANYKKKYDKQSLEAYKIIEGGKEKIDEFKANIYQSARKGDITEAERDYAINKIDRYQVYNDQIKNLPNMNREDKIEALKLSFNIEGLENEINQFTKEDLEMLDPIAKAKIESKKTLAKDLQKDLNRLLLRQDIQTETKVGDDTVKKVMKDITPNENTPKLKDVMKSIRANKKAESIDVKPVTSDKIDFDVENNRSMVRIPVSQFSTLGWNTMSQNNPLRTKAILGEHLKDKPNNQMEVIVKSGKNKTLTFDIGDNKQVKSAQSVDAKEGTPNYFKYQNLPKTKVEVQDRGGNPVLNEEGEPEFYYEEPVVMKRLDFPSKDKRTGEPDNKGVIAVYNKESGEFISFIREHIEGKSEYSDADKVHLGKIYNSNLYDKATMDEYSYDNAVKRKESIVKEAKPEKEEKVKPVKKPKQKVIKPELKLNEIKGDILNKKISVKKKLKGTELSEDVESNVKNEQAKITKKFEAVKKLLDCIHG